MTAIGAMRPDPSAASSTNAAHVSLELPSASGTIMGRREGKRQIHSFLEACDASTGEKKFRQFRPPPAKSKSGFCVVCHKTAAGAVGLQTRRCLQT